MSGNDDGAARASLYEILPRAEADRLIDALARILLAAAKVRAARARAATEPLADASGAVGAG
jgi:hypothetical protein